MDAGKRNADNTFQDGSNPAEDGLNRLEIVCTLTGTESSNPSLSASIYIRVCPGMPESLVNKGFPAFFRPMLSDQIRKNSPLSAEPYRHCRHKIPQKRRSPKEEERRFTRLLMSDQNSSFNCKLPLTPSLTPV